jgi:hypothetical protein
LSNIKTTEVKDVYIADGTSIKTSGIKGNIGNIEDVNYNPNFTHTLVSIGKLAGQGYIIVFDDNGANIYDKETDELLGKAEFRNSLFYVNLEDIKPSRKILRSRKESALVSNISSSDSYIKWHARLHLPKSSMKKILRLETLINFDVKVDDLNKDHTSCIHCLKARTDRQHKDYSYPLGKPKECIGGLVVTDIATMPIEGIYNIKYMVSFIDVYSDYKYLYYLKTKDEINTAFEKYITMIESYGHKIYAIHSDNGGENIGHIFREICENHRILYSTTTPYTPEGDA